MIMKRHLKLGFQLGFRNGGVQLKLFTQSSMAGKSFIFADPNERFCKLSQMRTNFEITNKN
jgi:hypothetical protein